ncbi:MAG: glycoside hydrolase family 13 protein [Treponema sp.]|nr:glycoside hydrolase family 13 protein [Treponema sp.]
MCNSIWLKSIYSDGSRYFVSNPLPKTGDKIVIAVQMIENPEVQKVSFLAKFNGVSHPKEMKKVDVKNGLARYEIEVLVFESELDYHFVIATNSCVYYYDEGGVKTYLPDESRAFRLLVNYTQPEWVKNAVFYQIFPDRFFNGNPNNDVKDGEYIFDGFESQHIADWNSAPKEYSEAHCLDFYGGDLEGIKQKIPYFKKLGITALYLNPIFYAATVHKYDCLDYFHVDPHFGGDEALSDLTKELHKNGIKIILDVSINHTGIANRWFNRDGTFFPKTEGAYNNPQSTEREFYFFDKNGSYKSWFDVKTLPTLNYTSEKLCNRLFNDDDSLVKKWLKAPYSTDGWRFDVADTMARNNEIQLHHTIWPKIRKAIKETNKDAYILAEDWSDCTEFLNGNEWDATMNYFSSCRPIRQFYGETDFHLAPAMGEAAKNYKMTAKDLSARITAFLTRLPFQVRQVQFNLIDSHDVPRFHNNPAISKEAVQGALILLFTLPGCTNMYYGDEVEIDGRIETIEGCRYPMPWNKDREKTDAYKLYSTLIKIKTTEEAFKDGGFIVLSDSDYVFAFARFTPTEVFISIASNDTEKRTLEMPIAIFGESFKTAQLSKTDALGQKIIAENKNGILKVSVPQGASFLIKISQGL